MKKIIAAALSILVGAFGYTIVDSTIENRVSRLESEVYELREEVSDYHAQQPTSEKSTEQNGFFVGKKLVKSSSSRSKFLIRIHNDGLVEYISPQNYSLENNSTAHTTTQFNGTTHFFEVTHLNETTHQNSYNLNASTKVVNVTETSQNYYDESSKYENDETTQILADPRDPATTNTTITTTKYHSSSTPGDYFVYLDTVSAVVSYADIEPSYYYDDDYSLSSKSSCSEFTITITYQGKADPTLAGERIEFKPNIEELGGGVLNSSIYLLGRDNNVINCDGSFKYTETYRIKRILYPIPAWISFLNGRMSYCIESVELSSKS